MERAPLKKPTTSVRLTLITFVRLRLTQTVGCVWLLVWSQITNRPTNGITVDRQMKPFKAPQQLLAIGYLNENPWQHKLYRTLPKAATYHCFSFPFTAHFE